MVELLRHRRTKGPVSARLPLNRRATPRLHRIDGALTAIAVLATIVLACAAALQQVDQDLVNEGLLDKVGGK